MKIPFTLCTNFDCGNIDIHLNIVKIMNEKFDTSVVCIDRSAQVNYSFSFLKKCSIKKKLLLNTEFQSSGHIDSVLYSSIFFP